MKIVTVKCIDNVDRYDYLIPVEECTCHVLPFDLEKAIAMTPSAVRKIYPRFFGWCASCGYYGTYYSSLAHYIAGDW